MKLRLKGLHRNASQLIAIEGPVWQSDFQQWWDDVCAKPFSAAYCRRLRSDFAMVMTWAFKDGVISYNPLPLLIDPPQLRRKARDESARDIKIISPQQFRLMVAIAGADLAGLMILSYYSSLALVDCCLLKWDSVDLDRAIIKYIRHKIKRFGRVVEIPMGAAVLDLLKGQHEIKLPAGQYLSEYVFPEAASKYFRHKSYYVNEFKGVAKKAGFPDLSFHCLRRAAISRWVSNPQADLLTVSAMSGHSKFSTLQRYVKASMEKKRTLVNTIEPEE